MKKKSDPRHIIRKEVAQHLFEWIFLQDVTDKNPKTTHIVALLPKLDAVIKKCAPQWPLDQINKVDLSVLRLAVYELFYEPETPPKVVIDEAIEIGKELGTDSSGSFINGVMGNVMNNFEEYKKAVKEGSEPATVVPPENVAEDIVKPENAPESENTYGE